MRFWRYCDNDGFTWASLQPMNLVGLLTIAMKRMLCLLVSKESSRAYGKRVAAAAQSCEDSRTVTEINAQVLT